MLKPSFIIFALSLAIGGLLYAPAQAGPVTGNPGEAPFTKAGVYGGVLSIVPGGAGNAVLELGNNGTDIAGTSDLYFRPGSSSPPVTVPAADAVRIYRTGSIANLFVGGKVCLFGPTEDCRDVWSGGGPAASLWQVTSENDPSYGAQSILEPIAAYSQFGLRLGSVGQPLTNLPALNVDSVWGAQVSNYQSDDAYALKVDGNVVSQPNEWVTIDKVLRINGNIPWHRWTGSYTNEGIGSGLDGDKIDGVDVRLEPAAACTQTNPAYPKLACLCMYFQGGVTKRCTDLSNHDLP